MFMPAEDLHGRAVGVDRLRPGDHAFFAYSDDEARWEILSVFTQQGFARDEKVGLLVDVGHTAGWVAERVAGGTADARRALRDGRLVVSNLPRFARGEFDAARLVEGARRRLDTVLAEGYSGLRSASEMSLALAPIDHLGQAVEYEVALHASLFSAPRTARYTALCYWDERLFGGTDAMKEARSVHPVIVLDRLGTLHATVSGNRVSVTGESDLASRTEFDEALRSLAALPADTLVLDITDLSFFDAHSAGAVVRLAAGLTPPRRLEVHCRSAQRRLLNLLGGRSLKQLSIITTRL
ncbi:MAG: hypothetical protein JWO75_5893 [Actinomycetia bacterium]|nr:hypothetical protein [Actinomycetes bacterium]